MTQSGSKPQDIHSRDWKYILTLTAVGVVGAAAVGWESIRAYGVESSPEVISRLRADRATALREADEAGAALEAVQNRLSAARTSLKETQAAAEEAEQTSKAAKTTAAEVERSLGALESEKEKLAKQRAELEDRVATLQKEVSELEQNKAGLDRSARSLDGQRAALQAEVSALEESRAKSVKRLAEADDLIKSRIDAARNGGARR